MFKNAPVRWTPLAVFVLMLAVPVFSSKPQAFYEKNVTKLEEMFLLLFRAHEGDLNETLVWEEVEEASDKTRREICDDVYVELFPNNTDPLYAFKSLRSTTGKSHKFSDTELLELEVGLVTVPVLECTYNNKTFYLTRATYRHVFVLSREGPQIYHLDSGLYRIFKE